MEKVLGGLRLRAGGHSAVVYTKKGFVYCGRCDVLMGCACCLKKLEKNKVIIGHNNKTHRANKKKLTRRDTRFMPQEILERL
jgi:hypothetical protein